MCGICGAVSGHGSDPQDEAILRRMCGTMVHRGPDDDGYLFDGRAMLGMRRLSIIDLATGRQPIPNEDRSLWLLCNGEIYNYRELRRLLEQRGHIFTTQSDSEVILHAYESFEEQCLELLNGMFAFAIWDGRRQMLFMARDRLGIKPLYYWSGGDQLVFGSELRALLAHPAVPREVDPVALDQFLTVEYIPAPRTILREVCKLPAGHWLRFQNSRLLVRPYWDVVRRETPNTVAACAAQLVELLYEAVRLQMVSDVPLGALLSGGLDSSTVVALMSQASGEPIRSFSIGFEEGSYDELPYAREVASRFNTDHHEEVLRPQIAPLADSLLGRLDEPLADFSILPTYLVCRAAGRSVKVVLSGDGGDELFGGYDTYVAQGLDGAYQRLPAIIRRRALPAVLDRVAPRPAKKGVINKTKRFVEGAALSPAWQHTRWMMFLSPADKASLYSPDLRDTLRGHDAVAFIDGHFRRVADWDSLAQQQYVDVKTYLADNILTKVDRMSMAASVEARVPLLDHRLVEFALSLPPHLKLRRGKTKFVLREAMRDRLPAAVLKRPKQGFSFPLKDWLRGPLRPMMLDLLSAERVRRRGYFEATTVANWIAEHLSGRANHSHRLWALMVFERWHCQLEAGYDT